MNRFVVVRYGEIALKKGNRKLFEKVLVNNIKRQLGRSTVERIRGRIIVSVPSERLRSSIEIMSRTFGIQNFSVGTWTSYDLEDIYLTSVDLAKDEMKRGRKTFKVETRRLDKRFPLKSVELNPLVGERILEELPETSVDIHNPEFKIEIEIRDEGVLISSGKTTASGGLPVGVSGRALLLLSGGIDSPVAGWLAQKRGLDLDAIHFSSPPYTGERSFDKVLSLAKTLSIYNGGREFRLYSMHFTDAQIAVHKHVEERYSLVCQRRLMMKIASKIAEAQRIIAIVTGENLGQVASQTLENLRVIEEQTELIVLRPLLSYDKIETIELAKQIGTFETSILPYEDCCTVFVPSNPVTKARLFDINRVEAGLDLECLAKDIIEKSKMYRIKNGDILEVKSIEIPEEAS
ncbi:MULTISPECIES: tRNA uracil 4-sulfurtransferase ThiI [Mesotoga]|jgi:thiamine biosynthesis protein ThiI|uniref:Probable tRNA sulfurtransferase n=1 Tax=Mesotoga prima MesG1.Ag.4.2 TaxID=660470 RepID=I2F248_9BACT|nr:MULTISPECIES: tRNA uracil 4-sulfurtransferase ThiI [Mesotoga]MCB1222658.1 tRNA 4-thiouridine(8) synthase ThiI [Mesotoga sp.]MCP5461426.1 tRNA 4-thiouridine(8) synthase ThiI [Thermotogota bacterium]AFK06001.1 thiazole biosynthesis/tRNA modification protein ThiI [Mesotoga prima MesG1.Ag.4.2]MDK2943861.1 tRNA uracil 4-sulfurtransferase [Mesotoga sp.]PIJ61812.1 thiamine biosynthesis protein ThiI [Mesotoga sp. H07.pep.5.3]